jgi:hypothetical protein
MKVKITEKGVLILTKIINDGFILEGNDTSANRKHWLTADESWIERPEDIAVNPQTALGLTNTSIFDVKKAVYGIKERNGCKVATFRYFIKDKYLPQIEDLIKSGKKSFAIVL